MKNALTRWLETPEHPILSALSCGTKSRHTGHRDTRVAQPHEHVRTDIAYCAERKLFSERVVGVEEQRAQKDNRFLRGWQIAYMIYEYFRATGACEAVQGLSDLFNIR